MHFFMYGHTVSAKSQQASVKAPVQVEFPVFALSKQSKSTIKKEYLTSSPKGNDRSPEFDVPRSNLISKNI